MAVIEELIRQEDNGTISFGNHLMDEKKKVLDFEVSGDLYKIKTFKEITKLEKNGKMLLETVPGWNEKEKHLSEARRAVILEIETRCAPRTKGEQRCYRMATYNK